MLKTRRNIIILVISILLIVGFSLYFFQVKSKDNLTQNQNSVEKSNKIVEAPQPETKTTDAKNQNLPATQDQKMGKLVLNGNCEAYVDFNEKSDCVLVDSSSGKTLFNFDKNNYDLYSRDNFKHAGYLIELGKQEDNKIFILNLFPSASSGLGFPGLGTLGGTLEVLSYDTQNGKIELISRSENIISWLCQKEPTGNNCDPDCTDETKEVAYQQKCFQYLSEDPKNPYKQEDIDQIKAFNFDFAEKLTKYSNLSTHKLLF